MNATAAEIRVAGPYYDDLELGQRFDRSPGLTLTGGLAALHQAIVGDRLRIALDAHLCAEVAGGERTLANPGLICDIAIGQSTLATQRVIGNLFYRGLVLRSWPRIGDTLRTTSEIVALRDNAPRPGRAPTGLAVLRVVTVDQFGSPVLDYHRCAMLPMRPEQAPPGHADDLDAISAELEPESLIACVDGLDVARFRTLVAGEHGAGLALGQRYVIETGDTVSAAPELVRLSLNVAGAHSDPAASGRGRRLVYGGHTIGLAASQLTRALPDLLTVSGWRSCDHLGPVYEGDVLHSTVTVSSLTPTRRPDTVLVDLHVETAAARERQRRARPRAGLAPRGGDGSVSSAAGILDGLRLIEGSAFVAAPLGGMTLAQLGADVVRFDQLGGGLDYQRWPLARDGQSLFWAGLNKGKRSIQLDLTSDEGRELVAELVAATGALLTNFPARGWLAYEALKQRRADLVMVALSGNPDGTSEVDYTVNPATGFPWATGPRNLAEPLNSVLPSWDLVMGGLAATGLLAAERHRARTGEGQLIRVALSDVAFATVGNLGRIAEAQLGGRDQRKDGNYLYGAFGHDFPTADGRRVMVVALTARQWRALVEATESASAFAGIEQATGHGLDTETGRYEARDLIAAILRPWFERRTLEQVRGAFTGTGVSWGPYQTFSQLVHEDPRASTQNPMFEEIEHPGVGRYLAPASPLEFVPLGRLPVTRAPLLGEHTEEILADVLGLSAREIGDLFDRRVVAGPGVPIPSS